MKSKIFMLAMVLLLLVTPLSFAAPNYFACNPLCFTPAYPSCDYCAGPCWACYGPYDGFFYGYGFGYGYGDEDDDGDGLRTMMADFSTSCEENVVTVTSGGNPLSNADVTVVDVSAGIVTSGQTDSNGELKFDGCDPPVAKVNIFVSKSGYKQVSMTRDLIDCAQCEEEEEETHLECVNSACVEVSGAGADECASKADCVEAPPEEPEPGPAPGCTSDADCAETDYCDIAVGAAGGNCVPVAGCGDVVDHALVPYECGDAPGCPACPEGYVCEDHKCVKYDVEGPETVLVDEEGEVTATENGGPCAFCELLITDPTGKEYTAETDEDGNVNVPFNVPGAWTFSLANDPTKSITVNALTTPTPEEEAKPTAAAEEPFPWFLLVLFLLLLLIGWLLWRRRGGPRPARRRA